MYPDFIAASGVSNKDIRSGMIIRKFRIKPKDLENFKMVLLGLSILHRKGIQISDIETQRKVIAGPGGTLIHSFWIFPEDEIYFRRSERELNDDPSVRTSEGYQLYQRNLRAIDGLSQFATGADGAWDPEAARRRALESVEAEAAALEEPPPFKP